METKGHWLHKSLLKHLPVDHDHTKFTSSGKYWKTPEMEICASLLALHVAGIDEGSFYELQDAVDEIKIRINTEKFNPPAWWPSRRRAGHEPHEA
jgi:hypothetical protein